MSGPTDKPVLTIRVSPETLRRLDHIATEEPECVGGGTRSAVARKALEKGIRHLEDQARRLDAQRARRGQRRPIRVIERQES
jgi:predicted transcriptional regulator